MSLSARALSKDDLVWQAPQPSGNSPVFDAPRAQRVSAQRSVGAGRIKL